MRPVEPHRLERLEEPHVECYVRSAIPGPLVETVETVVDRLERLSDAGRLATAEVTDWPPAAHATIGEATTREDLVARFEAWADDHGHSLEPAFRRHERPTASPASDEPARLIEQVRVPVVALAIYEGTTTALPDAPGELRAVLPYTAWPETPRAQTYGVREWLAIDAEPLSRPIHP